ncbi:arabinose efflux permease family protein [Prauserella sp. Am3]|nr:arabinose efflux permease family protein [Prauserella sp. Am3]
MAFRDPAPALLARLERLDVGRPHRKLRVQLGMGYAFDAMDTATVALILPAVTAVWGLSSGAAGVLGSSVLMGFVVGALASGAIGDMIGRRKVMLYALALFCLGSLLGSMSPSFEFLFASRVVTGIGCGAEAAIISVYASEFVAARHRGRYVAGIVTFFAYGYIMAALLGRFIVPLPEGWRWIQVVGAAPVLLILWWRRGLPESPRYLLARGRIREAEEVVASFERGTGHTPSAPSARPSQEKVATPPAEGVLRRYAGLFAPGLARVTGTTFFLWFVGFFAYFGFFTWIPSMLVAQGYPITQSFTFTIFINAAQLPGYYLAARLFDHVDQKFATIAFLTSAALSALWLANAGSTATILASAILMSFCMTGTMGGIYTYTPQVFPTRIRASGAGASAAVGRIGAIIAPIIIGFTFPVIGFGGVFALLMGVLLIGAAGLAVFGVRTKGKTLEEIEREETGEVDLTGETSRASGAPEEQKESPR